MPRSTASGVITFALVSIPVKFYTAARADNVSFNLLTPAGNRIKQKNFDAVTGAEVTSDECDKGYEHTKGEFIRFTKDELKALAAESDGKTIDITEFVDAGTIDPLWVEKSYYLGPDVGAEKGYLLLSQAMTEMKRVAVAQWNARGKENLVVIRPYQGGLVLHQMFYATEVQPFDEIKVSSKAPVTAAERDMATKLLSALSTSGFDASKYEDGYVERVRAAIADKINSGVIKTAHVEAPKVASVTDLTQLLAASLEAAAGKLKNPPGDAPKGKK